MLKRLLIILAFLGFTETVFSQQRITGNVKDDAGEPLPGVFIKIKGSKVGVQSDFDGNYDIKAKEGDVLVFSYLGMVNFEQAVGESLTYDIAMQPDQESLGEVQVVAYGRQSKVNLATTTSVVRSEAIENRPVVSLGEALQGLAPGLFILPMQGSNGSGGGVPGAGVQLSIRGPSSLSGSASPLILVDGVEMDINILDPNDIAEVTVLEDIASSAMYGARAAGGVILIQTKRGSAGLPTVTYSSGLQVQAFRNRPEKLSSLEFVTAFNEARRNGGQDDEYKAPIIERIKKNLHKQTADPAWDDNNDGTLNDLEYASNTDHFKYVFRQSAPRVQQNLAVSGRLKYGDKKDKELQYKLSGNYLHQEGMLKRKNSRNPKDYYTRRNVGLNLDSKPVNWITMGLAGVYTHREALEPLYAQWGPFSYNNGYGLLFSQLTDTKPTVAYEYDNNLGSTRNDNGIFLSRLSEQTNSWNNLAGNLHAILEPIKNWKTTFRYRFRMRNDQEERYIRKTFWYNLRTKENVARNPNNAGAYYKDKSSSAYTSPQIFSQYQLTRGNHYASITVGAEQEYRYWERLTASKRGGVSNLVQSLNTGTGDDDVSEGKTHWATQSVFAGLSYTFGKRYVLNASVRRDGSSKFVEGKRWGTFYSYALAYNVSNEPALKPFFKKAKINFLKLKFSSGQIGKQDIGLYTYLETLSIRTNNGWLQNNSRDLYTTNPSIRNANKTWETMTDNNFGIEFQALNKRLSGNFTYYNRKTTDMLGPVAPLPSTLGASAPLDNNAELTNRGFTATLGWQDKIGDFSYRLQFQLSDNETEVTKYRNPEGLLNTWYKGRKFGEIWGYETVGFMDADTADRVNTNSAAADTPGTSEYPNQHQISSTSGRDGKRWSEGDFRYKDLNGDGKITRGERTLEDPGDRKIIGNSTYRYRYTLDSSFGWKGFGLRLFFTGVGKRDILLSGNQLGFGDNRTFKEALDYWRPDNKGAFYPKPYRNTGKNRIAQSKYVINGAFMRLKNITVSYNVPKQILKRIGVRRLSFTFSADNIFTITDKRLPSRIDPELPTSGLWGRVGAIHPLYRTYSLGLNLTI